MANLATNSQLEYIHALHIKAFGHVTKNIDKFTVKEASEEIQRVQKILKKTPRLNGGW